MDIDKDQVAKVQRRAAILLQKLQFEIIECHATSEKATAFLAQAKPILETILNAIGLNNRGTGRVRLRVSRADLPSTAAPSAFVGPL